MAEPRHIGYFDESVVQHEFRAKFANCFVVLENNKLPKQYWHIDTNEDGTSVIFTNARDRVFRVTGGYLDSDTGISVIFPKTGWYIHGDTGMAFFIRRVPRRQWRRAPNRDNMSVSWLDDSFAALSEAVLTTDILNQTLNPVNKFSKDNKDLYEIIDRKWLIAPYNERFKTIWYLDKVMAVIDTEQNNRVLALNRWAQLPKEIFGRVEIPKTMSLKR